MSLSPFEFIHTVKTFPLTYPLPGGEREKREEGRCSPVGYTPEGKGEGGINFYYTFDVKTV